MIQFLKEQRIFKLTCLFYIQGAAKKMINFEMNNNKIIVFLDGAREVKAYSMILNFEEGIEIVEFDAVVKEEVFASNSKLFCDRTHK